MGGIFFKREKGKEAEAEKEITKARSKVIFEAGWWVMNTLSFCVCELLTQNPPKILCPMVQMNKTIRNNWGEKEITKANQKCIFRIYLDQIILIS